MKIVLAPDKFKDCLTAAEVAEAIAEGLRSVDPEIEIDICPMADGGEGTVAALVAATGGRIVEQKITGPLPHEGHRRRSDCSDRAALQASESDPSEGDLHTAVIEMAAASGLWLLKPDQRDPTRTTTYGTGELMRAAADLGARRIILGIGGSATVDGGIGAAQAWGAKFTFISGQTYSNGDRRLTGGDLERLLRVETNRVGKWQPAMRMLEDQTAGKSKRAAKNASTTPPPPDDFIRLDTGDVEFIVACDVGNPLLGPNGAATIFGPQKGANPTQIAQLENGLCRLVERTGKDADAILPGAGAAGGLGFGMRIFFGATLRPGIDIVMDTVKLRQRIQNADLCITGEGRLDAQTLSGKTVIGVARACEDAGVPCIALAGTIGEGAEECLSAGLSSFHAITDRPMTLEESMRDARDLLARAAANILRTNLAHRQGETPWSGNETPDSNK